MSIWKRPCCWIVRGGEKTTQDAKPRGANSSKKVESCEGSTGKKPGGKHKKEAQKNQHNMALWEAQRNGARDYTYREEMDYIAELSGRKKTAPEATTAQEAKKSPEAKKTLVAKKNQPVQADTKKTQNAKAEAKKKSAKKKQSKPEKEPRRLWKKSLRLAPTMSPERKMRWKVALRLLLDGK